MDYYLYTGDKTFLEEVAYPGTLINSSHQEGMNAAGKTLDLRGEKTTGWAIAHRMNARARLKEGEKAHNLFARLLAEKTTPNLWTLHPPFQIDANLGAMAGDAEMLLQSHEDWIELLPALPEVWETRSFKGLVARGNFVIDAEWTAGRATRITVTARNGGECRIACPGISKARFTDDTGRDIAVENRGTDRISFNTAKDGRYIISPHF
ncbi:MAG: glycoside hydrolase family 95-like protein [Verrucomicrobiota bacterium]